MRYPAILLGKPAPNVCTLPRRTGLARPGAGPGAGSRLTSTGIVKKTPASTVAVIWQPQGTAPETMPPLRRRRLPISKPRKRPVDPVPVCYVPALRRLRHPPPRLRQQRGRAPPPHRGQAPLARSPRGSSRRGGCPCIHDNSLPSLRRWLSAPSPKRTATHPRLRQEQGVPA